ncbi:putative Protein kinase domain [Paratrimastix pyriformis]|uniref:Protein kinase domain-containing protein n=1 Tax=Paratrimastix pyriformis TaxID=342808 RepID=A0ABQ8UTS1_9EUKA|nr:putative Protein kinase domain [Paratrimastix pyriformis]
MTARYQDFPATQQDGQTVPRTLIFSDDVSHVYKMQDLQTNNVVAIKEVDCSLDESLFDSCIQEGFLQGRLRHSGIVPCINIFRRVSQDHSSQHICLVLPLCDFVRMDQAPLGTITMEQCDQAFQRLLEVLEYLCNERVMHCNLKPASIFICSGHLFLGDFSRARDVSGQAQCLLPPSVPVDYFSAPEMAQHVPCTLQSDLFSAGLVLICLYGRLTPAALRHLLGDCPPHSMPETDLHGRVRQILASVNRTPGLLPLAQVESAILGLLSRDPCRRPTADSLLQRLFPQPPNPSCSKV